MSGYKYGSCYYGKIEDVDWERWQKLVAVSYTHLTLPTTR